eukprot:m51a1_g2584 hypothetical protein (369) ;mRNA; r:405955-407190
MTRKKNRAKKSYASVAAAAVAVTSPKAEAPPPAVSSATVASSAPVHAAASTDPAALVDRKVADQLQRQRRAHQASTADPDLGSDQGIVQPLEPVTLTMRAVAEAMAMSLPPPLLSDVLAREGYECNLRRATRASLRMAGAACTVRTGAQTTGGMHGGVDVVVLLAPGQSVAFAYLLPSLSVCSPVYGAPEGCSDVEAPCVPSIAVEHVFEGPHVVVYEIVSALATGNETPALTSWAERTQRIWRVLECEGLSAVPRTVVCVARGVDYTVPEGNLLAWWRRTGFAAVWASDGVVVDWYTRVLRKATDATLAMLVLDRQRLESQTRILESQSSFLASFLAAELRSNHSPEGGPFHGECQKYLSEPTFLRP